MQKTPQMSEQNLSLAKLIDHTALKQEDFKQNKLLRLSQEAVDNHFNSICIRPEWLPKLFQWYQEKNFNIPKISIVGGFPQKPFTVSASSLSDAIKISKSPTQDKVTELRKAIEFLISNSINFIELDPVLDISSIEESDFTDRLSNEITAYLKLCKEYTEQNSNLKIFLKPIFSSELLIKQAQKAKLNKDYYLELSVKAICAAYSTAFGSNHKSNQIFLSYKNSTGFVTDEDLEKGSYGAGTDDSLVTRLTKLLDMYEKFFGLQPKTIGIKAAGGVKDQITAWKIIKDSQGRLTHIGSSSGLTICNN